MVGILPVLAGEIAGQFGVELSTIFLGSSVMFVTMGLTSPWAGSAFRRFGARQVMAAGAVLIGVGLCIVALAPTVPVFLFAWAVVGVAGSMFLTTSAFAYIAEYSSDRARGLIGTLMLATGLAGGVFFPLTALLDHWAGWRTTTLIYAATMSLLVCPLVRLALPASRTVPTAMPKEGGNRGKGRVFGLIAVAIALNGFVTFGVQAVGIELFRALGADLAKAVAIASLVSAAKVGGRIIDLLGGSRWDALSTAMVSGAMIPLGLAAVWSGGASLPAVAGYLALFGIGSGAFAVARATMPLVFYSKTDYAVVLSATALPLNLVNALAAPVLASLLTRAGPQVVLGTLAGTSIAALFALLYLARLRTRSAAYLP